MRKLIAYGLIVAGILIVAHHWYIHDSLVDLHNVLSHEFFAVLFSGLGLGGLML